MVDFPHFSPKFEPFLTLKIPIFSTIYLQITPLCKLQLSKVIHSYSGWNKGSNIHKHAILGYKGGFSSNFALIPPFSHSGNS